MRVAKLAISRHGGFKSVFNMNRQLILKNPNYPKAFLKTGAGGQKRVSGTESQICCNPFYGFSYEKSVFQLFHVDSPVSDETKQTEKGV
jgi:hypothetical protein